MNRTSLASAAVTLGAVAVVVAVPGTSTARSGSVHGSAAAFTADVPQAGARKTRHYSFRCASPAGGRFNVSFNDEGMNSTTFYFNNHCRQKHWIKIWKRQKETGNISGGCTLHINAQTRGRKKVINNGGYWPYKVTSPRNCEDS